MIIKPRGSVIVPKMPRSVGSILSWCREVNRAIQQLRDRAFVTYGGGSGGGGVSEPIPFKLSQSRDPDTGDLLWRVAQTKSSITDGTNGDAIDLGPSGAAWSATAIKFDVDTVIAATKYIVLEADVDASLVLTDWTLAAVDLADAIEVGTDAGPPVIQNKIRLIIGKVTVDTAPDPDAATASQAVFSSQLITHGLMNGMGVKVFESAPINPANL